MRKISHERLTFQQNTPSLWFCLWNENSLLQQMSLKAVRNVFIIENCILNEFQFNLQKF